MAAPDEGNRITLGDLREWLGGFPDHYEVTFGCTRDAVPLIYYRVKQRGPELVQIELNELCDD